MRRDAILKLIFIVVDQVSDNTSMSVFMASNTVQEEWECGLDEDGDTITLKEYKEEEGGTVVNVGFSKFDGKHKRCGLV